MNDFVTNVVDYGNYALIKYLAQYDDNMANKLNRMKPRTAVQMKDPTFYRKNRVSIIPFLQVFKAVCDACSSHDGVEVWLFRNYLNGPVEAVIKARIASPTKMALAQEGCLTSYSAIFP